MQVELDTAEVKVIRDLIMDNIEGVYEVLKDEHDTIEAAMAAYDKIPEVKLFVKLDPLGAENIRAGVKGDVAGYLDRAAEEIEL